MSSPRTERFREDDSRLQKVSHNSRPQKRGAIFAQLSYPRWIRAAFADGDRTIQSFKLIAIRHSSSAPVGHARSIMFDHQKYIGKASHTFLRLSASYSLLGRLPMAHNQSTRNWSWSGCARVEVSFGQFSLASTPGMKLDSRLQQRRSWERRRNKRERTPAGQYCGEQCDMRDRAVLQTR